MKNKGQYCIIKSTLYLLIASIFYTYNAFALVDRPVAIDTRIKTLIFSPNEIFSIKLMVNYQSIIELERDEEVEIMAFGDPLPWVTRVVSSKIFIKALDQGVKTNLTIVTNKRTYLMEISSTTLDESDFNDQLVYVVRFFYPEINVDISAPTKPKDTIAKIVRQSTLNTNYTFTGSSKIIMPIKMFDDGKRTFIQFGNNNAIIPVIYEIVDGIENVLKYSMYNEYIVINGVASQMSMRYDKELLCIFNEKKLAEGA